MLLFHSNARLKSGDPIPNQNYLPNQSEVVKMAAYTFSSLLNGQHLTFSATADILNFSGLSDNASAVRLSTSGASLGFTLAGKTIWLDTVGVGQMSLTNIAFANGSQLLVGDGTTSTLGDWYGQDFTSLSSSTVGNQVWGLGGADIVQTGSGADWLVGNVAMTPLNHVNSVGSTGSPTGAAHASISADGRFIAFEGGWTAFGSTNNSATDILVKDVTSGTVSNEHKTSGGVNGGSGSGSPIISADGKLVAFSSASTLVAGPNSGSLYDIYIASTGSSAIERVSTGTGDVLAANGRALDPDLSGDGRYVTFTSDTSNFAANSTNTNYDIFIKDRVSGTLTRVSSTATGGDGNGDSINGKVSADGRFVTFESTATNLNGASDINGYSDIFVWDNTDGSITNITAGLTALGNPNNGCYKPDIAYDGDYGGVIVFQTARGLVAEDTSNGTDIYAYNARNDTIQLVSSKADGSGVQLSSEDASISGDGRFVVFTSYSDELVAGDTNGTRDIFVKDLFTGAIALVSKSAAGVAANAASEHAQISLGGEWIVFESSATNLASNDANGSSTDIYRVSNPLLKDTLAGGAGNDTYVISRNDIITELAGGGTDTVQSSISYTLGSNLENLLLTGTGNLNGNGNSLNNVITGNVGNNILNGNGGTDTVSYANANAAVAVNLALTTQQATGFGSDTLSNFENMIGSGFADQLTGNGGNNRIDGGAGNDVVTGAAGNDSLLGSAGDDKLNGDDGDDLLNGNTGNDTLTGGNGSDTYYCDSAADIVVESGTVTTEIDTVNSTVAWTLGARLENLTLSGTAAINGGGNSSNNKITGNAAANLLNGYAGNDTLIGGDGSDTLIGGAGTDSLTGGLGADGFTLNSTVGSDIISDFLSGTDKIRISQSALPVGDGDLLVEGAVTVTAPGGFSSTAELIIVSTNLSSISATTAAAAIGSATTAYTVGRTALFAVDDGTSSAVYRFTSSGADAQVSSSELVLLGTLNGTVSTVAADYTFVA